MLRALEPKELPADIVGLGYGVRIYEDRVPGVYPEGVIAVFHTRHDADGQAALVPENAMRAA